MLRTVARSAVRVPISRPSTRALQPTRRFIGTSPPAQRSRSWKSLGLRWALAIGAVYYYNTSDVFAEAAHDAHYAPDASQTEEALPTIEELAAERKRRLDSRPESSPGPSALASAKPASLDQDLSSPAELEEEADQQGAFNPETGEINWDCPCLGGMAYGPCGEEFRAAFSCFVYSDEEPKGMDCIDKFKGMQDCFRAHPDVYGAELEDDEDEAAVEGTESEIPEATAGTPSDPQPPTRTPEGGKTPSPKSPEDEAVEGMLKSREAAQKATEEVRQTQKPLSESDEVVPKAWHDTTESNEKTK